MASVFLNEARTPVGQIALHGTLNLMIPSPVVQSFVVAGARRTRETETYIEEYYPSHYNTDGTLIENLRFALKHEPLDLRVVSAALEAIGEDALTAWVRTEPTGAFSRRAWFFYETLIGRTLDLEAVKAGNYVDALDERRHFVAAPINSSRHRVRDNLLGTRDLCPVVRRTPKLEAMIAAHLDAEARAMAAHYSPETLARAVNFLYTKETRSSFAIEGEAPSRNREERFLQALQAVSTFDPADKNALIRLQGSIVDPRYAAHGWRDFQNFVGETTRRFGEYVHFICPRPEDISSLMEGWMALTERLLISPLDPVIAAAVSAFAFVFLHPFEDGNGRIHRFLIHYILSKRGFSPPGVIFPVSAAILRQRHLYDKTLEAFSKPIMAAIEWDFVEENALQVQNDTCNLYRFFDATPQAEYLYERVAETIRVDFKEELDFLEVYDAAFTAVREIVDMPDRRASLLVRLCLQNGGRLSQNKRKQFVELTDEEINQIEAAILRVLRQEL
ncbi:MAG TPA: Fic family protein [Chthonomonadaceae bacterium]|nr:Fic family protein [Chthonomonadaceae bacterium]